MENFLYDFNSYQKLVESFSHVIFFDKDHTYSIDGKKVNYSVTKLLSKYKKPFDSHNISKAIARKEGVEQEDVLAKWDFTKDYANHKGTEFHLYVENYLERRHMPIDRAAIKRFLDSRSDFCSSGAVSKYYTEFAKLVANFLKFYEWYKTDHILIKSEFVIGDKLSRLAGTLDNLSYNTQTKELVIFDYKTNKEINKTSKYRDKMLAPLDHLDNCEYNTYALQLWLYKIIIERNTPFIVGDCNIFWFAGDDFEKFEIPNLRKEAENLLDIEIASNNQ